MRHFISLLVACLLVACSARAPAQSQTETLRPHGPAPKPVELTYFGYSAIACDHDDPHDESNRTDYSLEVASFTNANQVCITADPDLLVRRLRETSKLYRPLFYIEPVFFSFSGSRGHLNKDYQPVWDLVTDAISQSGTDPDSLVFYLVDEPELRGLSQRDINTASAQIKSTYPHATIMMIEAYLPKQDVHIPQGIDWWGFDAYTLRDPGADPAYVAHLNAASAARTGGQALVMIMDAQHTPIHEAAGLSEADMADVARNYLRLAQSRNDVIGLFGYTWAGGIDGNYEKGVRDMPENVQAAHREIGREIVK